MNFDIASELSGLFDFSKTIPSLTISFIAASGILLLCACILVTFTARRIVGLRFMPVLYGATSYLLFYIMIGSFLSGLPHHPTGCRNSHPRCSALYGAAYNILLDSMRPFLCNVVHPQILC